MQFKPGPSQYVLKFGSRLVPAAKYQNKSVAGNQNLRQTDSTADSWLNKTNTLQAIMLLDLLYLKIRFSAFTPNLKTKIQNITLTLQLHWKLNLFPSKISSKTPKFISIFVLHPLPNGISLLEQKYEHRCMECWIS